MSWTGEHDLILSKEILFMNPHRAKKRERSEVVCGKGLTIIWMSHDLVLKKDQFVIISPFLFSD